TLVTAGYLGWIVFALATVIDLHVLHGDSKPVRSLEMSAFFFALWAALNAALYIQHSPPTYYGYAFFPFFFWHEVLARKDTIRTGLKQLFSGSAGGTTFIG